jgi:beta-mannosidase
VVSAQSLDGEGWQVRPCLGDEWQWHVAPDKPWGAAGWLPARVPGSVIDDLVRAGEASSPYHERDSRLLEWAPERAWVYRRRFRTERSTLRFAGVDHSCTVLVDGDELARNEGMFRAFDVDVAPFADGEEHLLAVVVHPAPASEPQVGRTSRVRSHKTRMNYGWDFCPRLVHQGIWRSVTLAEGPERFPQVSLADGVGTVVVDGETVLRVEEPELWWPNGLGAQRLYVVEVDGTELSVGFRTVELVAPEEGTLPYAFVINGVPMYGKGWNWCPLDALYGVPRPERLTHLLELAARAGCNLLRIWGGGLIETEEFYAHCDRLGLLVWQEFVQSSSGLESVPAADDGFVSLLREDARSIVPRLRRHPSLALWCGGNELAGRAEGRDDVPLDDTHPVLATLHEVVDELDPGRGWLPTSPSGPRFLNRLDVIEADPAGQHDVHGPWEHQGLRAHYALYDSGTAILHSEFGVEGMTNRRALEELIDEPHRWPADRSNPVYEHLGAWWNNAALVHEIFGGRLDDLETMRRASQWLQYDGLRYAVEANMRRARSVGVLPWQFNESFPNAWCTAAVDWQGVPKPAYWGVARAYLGAPSAQFATCAWGGEREMRARVHGGATARVVNLDGMVVATAHGEIAVPLEELSDVFLLDLDGRNRYVMTTAATLEPLLDAPPTTLELAGGRLRNTGDVTALGVVLEAPPGSYLDDNVIDLLPGESRAVGAALGGEGWNAHV